jgi:hypothetical protein
MQFEESDEHLSITTKFIQQIVKESDEATISMIENYVRQKQAEGEIILSTIIPEGKLRHIINLGITTYNEIQKEPRKLLARNYFTETVYNEYLHQELLNVQRENQRLRNQITILERNNDETI